MPEYDWNWLYKQDSEYASGPKYAKILVMAKFWIWQSSQYANVTQRSEYTRICLERWMYLRFWICPDCEYGKVLNMQE